LPYLLNGNLVAELQTFMRTYDGGGGSSHSFNLLDEELGKFVGTDVSWGWHRPLSSKKTDENNRRSYGHAIFRWSAIV